MNRFFKDSQGNVYSGDRQSLADTPITEEEAVALKQAKADTELAEAEAALTYADKRAREYPDYREYLDGIVKSNSTDPAVKNDGEVQVKKYIADCLAIKAKYPKE